MTAFTATLRADLDDARVTKGWSPRDIQRLHDRQLDAEEEFERGVRALLLLDGELEVNFARPRDEDPAADLRAEGEAFMAELDGDLTDSIDELLLLANGFATLWLARRAVRRAGGPKWAQVGVGRIAGLVAMSPSRKPLATKLRENVERALKDWKAR